MDKKGQERMTTIRRIQIGKWRFAYSFGHYRVGIRRDAKRAGSVAFGFGMFTYMKVGKYESLPQGAWLTS